MKKMTNTERIKSVVSNTAIMFVTLNIFLIPLIYIIALDEDVPMNWDYIVYVNLYAIIVSVVFGFLDKPKLENKILIFLLILSLLIWVIPNQFSTHFCYVFWGIFMGRVLLTVIDSLITSTSKDN
jgi:hypothetical protein